MVLAAQQNDEVTSYFMRRLMREEQSTVDPDECHSEFKVMATQMKYLSVVDEANSEVPRGVLFYKKSRIVAPSSIRTKLMAEAHGTGHTGITKTYNQLRTLWWRPNLFTNVKRMIDTCQVCLITRTTNLCKLAYHLLEITHSPREIVYLDLIGPVCGIRSENRYVLTAIDSYSRFLATRPIPNR